MDNREYVIVCNEHKGWLIGTLMFWGTKTEDSQARSYDGYTYDLDNCERYTREELENNSYKFPFYNGEDEIEFMKLKDVCIRVDDLLALKWLKPMRICYRP